MPNRRKPCRHCQTSRLWVYRAMLLVPLVGLACPWLTTSSSSSVNYGDLGHDYSKMGLGNFGGRELERMGNLHASASISVTGINTAWGGTALLAIIGGIAVELRPPAVLRQPLPWLLMGGAGIVSLVLAILFAVNMNSYFQVPMVRTAGPAQAWPPAPTSDSAGKSFQRSATGIAVIMGIIAGVPTHAKT